MNSDENCGQTHLAAAWALGTLTSDEAQRFGAHLAVCATCQAEVASLREAAEAMADAAPPVAPPPQLGARLMAAIWKEAELFRAAAAYEPHPVNDSRPRRRLLRSTLLVVTAVSLIVAGTVLGGLLAEPEDRRVESRVILGIVTRAAGAPDARAAILVRGDEITLVLSDIDRPPNGRIYQAWLERPPSTPVPTGALFSVGVTGDTTISLPPLGDARRMIVTSEPPGGSTAPTLPPVVLVDLPAPGRTSG
ncbi:MAG: anti-sigma factor [Actinomycetota bacterium]|nr:anti-sigma factor [Actinomycetota bacterium]